MLVLRCPEWPVPPDPDAGRAFERVVSLVEELCPRVEVLWPGACAIGARGPARYFGGEEALAGKIIEAVTGGGFACQAGIADGLFAAQLAARAAAPGTVTMVPPGQAREFLAPYPVGVLDSGEMAELLPRLDSEGVTELLPRLGIVDAGGLRPAACQPGGEPVRGRREASRTGWRAAWTRARWRPARPRPTCRSAPSSIRPPRWPSPWCSPPRPSPSGCTPASPPAALPACAFRCR